MIAFVRYTSGLGNAALYARLRNAIGQFWDFTALTWGVIGTNCKQFLLEHADSDPTTSYYSKEIIPPAQVLCIEVVVDATSLVIGYESTKDAGAYVPESGIVVSDVTNSSIYFKTDLASTVDSYCVGSFVKFVNGTLINQTRKISGYGGTSKTISVTTGFTGIPAAGNVFIIINQ